MAAWSDEGLFVLKLLIISCVFLICVLIFSGLSKKSEIFANIFLELQFDCKRSGIISSLAAKFIMFTYLS